MTIEKGQAWGSETPRPQTERIAPSDATIIKWWEADPSEPIVLTGGDLYRSLGSPETVRDPAVRFPIDVIEATTDHGVVFAAAHVIARRRWWRGRVVGVLNSDYLGAWNAAPRAHPNDGRADVVDVAPAMTWRQRWQARQRLPTGTHLPHPSIKVSTPAEASFEFDRPTPVWVDGQRQAPTRRLRVRVLPDAAVVIA